MNMIDCYFVCKQKPLFQHFETLINYCYAFSLTNDNGILPTTWKCKGWGERTPDDQIVILNAERTPAAHSQHVGAWKRNRKSLKILKIKDSLFQFVLSAEHSCHDQFILALKLSCHMPIACNAFSKYLCWLPNLDWYQNAIQSSKCMHKWHVCNGLFQI